VRISGESREISIFAGIASIPRGDCPKPHLIQRRYDVAFLLEPQAGMYSLERERCGWMRREPHPAAAQSIEG